MKTLLLLLVVGVAHAQVNNTALGEGALSYNTTGNDNSAFGVDALLQNQHGNGNTAVGMVAMQRSTDGTGNTAVGSGALRAIAGDNNIGIGYMAGSQVGYNNATGNHNNIEIGNYGFLRDTGVIRIGTQGIQRWTQIAGIYESKVVGGRAVVVDSKGHLGYAVTKVVPNTADDVGTLRAEVAELRAELRLLKAQVAGVKPR